MRFLWGNTSTRPQFTTWQRGGETAHSGRRKVCTKWSLMSSCFARHTHGSVWRTHSRRPWLSAKGVSSEKKGVSEFK